MKIRFLVPLLVVHLCFAGVAAAQENIDNTELKHVLGEHSYHKRAIELLEEYRSLLQTFADIAEEKFKADQGSQHDVLIAQLEALKLVGSQAEHERRLNATRALINRLLSRSPETRIETPSVDTTLNELPYSLEELHRSALKNSAPAGRQGKNGSALLQRHTQNEHEHAVASALYFALEQAYSEAATAQRLIQLYKTSLIPLAGFALESALGSYQTGTTDFQQLINTVLIALDAQMNYCRAATDYRKALAQMEALTGLDLTLEKENANAS